MLIQGTKSRGAIATASSLAVAAVLVLAACETPAPVIAPEQPSLGVAPDRVIRLPSFDDMEEWANGVGTPLTYVEGVRLSDAEFRRILESLDPSTVSSIEVIKNPAAVELYGAEATGGVIRMDLKDRAARAGGGGRTPRA